MSDVRLARYEDIDEIARVRMHARHALPDEIVPQKMKDYQNFAKKLESTRGVREQTLRGEKGCYVYEYEGKIVGVLIIHITPAELGAVYIDPAYQGRGIGRSLFTFAVDEFRKRGESSFFLWGIKGNTQSYGFYTKMGCTCTGEEEIYTRNGTSLYSIKYTYEIR